MRAPRAEWKIVQAALAATAQATLTTTDRDRRSLNPHTPSAARATAPSRPAGPELTVQYVAGNMISLSGPAAGLQPMQFGRVVGKDGSTIARVVIVQVLETGLVVSAVENGEKITRGARVRFDPP